MTFWHINRLALPLLLTLSLLLAPKALAADRVTAQANNIDVQFNGRPLELGAYNIANNNYVKLRDVAQLLSGTEKSVSVTWNNDAFCIELIRGGLYQPAGGELTPLSGGSQSAVLNSAAVLLDGKAAALTAYNIGGSNFFKLRDLGSALDFRVDWDAGTGTVVVDTTKGYSGEETSAPGTASTSKYAMAKSMLDFLEEADEVPFCYLIDLNHDGTEELISVRVSDYYWTAYFSVWKDGKLASKELDVLAGSPSIQLCEDSATGEQGVAFLNGDAVDSWVTFYYVSHTTETLTAHVGIDVDPSEYAYLIGDKVVTKAEYDAAFAQNRLIKDLEAEDSESSEKYNQATYDQLYKMAGQAPLETDA